MDYKLDAHSPPPDDFPDPVMFRIFRMEPRKDQPDDEEYSAQLYTDRDTWVLLGTTPLVGFMLVWLHRHGFRPIADVQGGIEYTRTRPT